MNEPLPRFTEARHFQRCAPGGIWIEDLSAKLEEILEETWDKLPPGGFIGGPIWGCGPISAHRFSVNTRTSIDRFLANQPDASEIILGDGDHPCWMAFKRKPEEQRVLILSGSDERQYHFFGELAEKNHRHYAEKYGYEQRWLTWDRDTWDWDRGSFVWAKHFAMSQALAEGCWDQVWWLDADAVFINLEKRLDHFLHPEWDGIFPQFLREDRVMLSTGIFGGRPALSPLLHQLWTAGGEEKEYCEETLLTTLGERDPDAWKKVQLVEHSVINGYYGWNVYPTDPARNFICHMVGRPNVERRRLFTEVNRYFGI